MLLRLRLYVLALFLAAFAGLLFTVAARQLYSRGAQGEAKLMLGYIHTLERVYRLETRLYLFWNIPYGSNIGGLDHCAQPIEAAELGFLLPGCHRKQSPPSRYAYSVAKTTNGEYIAEARSGSDHAGRSVVCFQTEGNEIWQSDQKGEHRLIVACP